MNTFSLNPAESFLPTTADSGPQQTLFPWLPGKPVEPESAWTRNRWLSQAQRFAIRSRYGEERRRALAADKIRPFCGNHPVQVDYSWSWPDESRLGLESTTRPVPGELQYKHFLTDLYRQISAEIAHELSTPGRVFRDRHSVRIEFMHRIAWVVIQSDYELRTEFRDRHGRWQMTTSTFPWHNPLESADWIDQVLMPWLPRLSMLPEAQVQAGYDWLRASLRERFHNAYWLKGLKRQVRFHLNTSPEFGRLLVHFGRLQKSLDLDEVQFRELCKRRIFWAELHARHPGISYFCYLAVEYGMVREGDDLGELRRQCLEQGLSRAAWCFLVRHGANAFRATIDSSLAPEQICENAMNFIEWQTRAGLDQPMPTALGRNFIATCGMYLTPEQVGLFDPRIARAVGDHWSQLPTAGEQRRFAAHDWVKVLLWLRDEQPIFDRNQWRAGWPAIWRAYLKWQSLHGDDSSWTSCLATFEVKDWRITPLTSSYQLAMEGLRMRHCVSAYAARCLPGNYRLFSVSCQFTGKSLATIGLIKKDDGWEVEQVKGPCNREPVQVIRELAGQILKRYTEAEARAQAARQGHRKPDPAVDRRARGLYDLRVSRFYGSSVVQTRAEDGRWVAVKPENYFFPRELVEKIRSVSCGKALIPSFALPDEEEWQYLDDLVFDICADLRAVLPPEFRVFRDDGLMGGEIEVN